jgi:hypothetical protein
MPQVRKLVTSGLYALLSSDDATGFNQQYRELLGTGEYPSAELVEINWKPGVQGQDLQDPKQFFIGEIDEAQLGASQLLKFPAVNLFTLEIDGGPSDQREKFRTFSGMVYAGLKWMIKHRDGAEVDNIEDTIAAIDDAVLEVINGDLTSWPPGVAYNGEYKSGPPRNELLGNGWLTIFPSTIGFFVSV